MPYLYNLTTIYLTPHAQFDHLTSEHQIAVHYSALARCRSQLLAHHYTTLYYTIHCCMQAQMYVVRGQSSETTYSELNCKLF